MNTYTVIKFIVAIGIVIGGLDFIGGCRFHLGEKFQEGFTMSGKMMLSIAGIMSITPFIADLLKPIIVPSFQMIGADPAVFGILLGCDMGGYQMAVSLADSREIALMVGLWTASMVGGTLTFTIPVGQAMLEERDLEDFYRGILIGILAIPFGSLCGGFLMGVSWQLVLINHIPVILLSLLIAVGFRFIPGKVVRIVEYFGKAVMALGVLGIMIGAVSYLLDREILPGFTPIMDSMKVVCSMTIVLIGMLPILELFNRILRKPLNKIGEKVHLDGISASGLIFTLASSVPTFAMMKKMNKRGIVINAAWSVTCAATLGSQLSFVMGVEPQMIGTFTIVKFISGVVALLLALYFTRNDQEHREGEGI